MNRLQDMREFLPAGDEDSARKLIENLYKSVVSCECFKCRFSQITGVRVLGTSLIPDVDDDPGHRTAAHVKSCSYVIDIF